MSKESNLYNLDHAVVVIVVVVVVVSLGCLVCGRKGKKANSGYLISRCFSVLDSLSSLVHLSEE